MPNQSNVLTRCSKKTHDACDLIANEVRRLVSVRLPHQKIIIETPCHDCKHEIATSFCICISSDVSPHFECIREESVFGGALLIFTVCRLEKALGEGMTVIPIKHSGEREQWVTSGGRGSIAYQKVDPRCIQSDPTRIEMGDNGSCVDEIAWYMCQRMRSRQEMLMP